MSKFFIQVKKNQNKLRRTCILNISIAKSNLSLQHKNLDEKGF